ALWRQAGDLQLRSGPQLTAAAEPHSCNASLRCALLCIGTTQCGSFALARATGEEHREDKEVRKAWVWPRFEHHRRTRHAVAEVWDDATDTQPIVRRCDEHDSFGISFGLGIQLLTCRSNRCAAITRMANPPSNRAFASVNESAS